MLNQSDEPTPLSALRLPTHRQDQSDVTDSSRGSIWAQSGVFSFYSTDGASGTHNKKSFRKLSIHSYALVFWLGLLHVEADSSTSTVALRVVGGDEKGTQCLGYNRATLFLTDINTGT
jgi:hypothetical protein